MSNTKTAKAKPTPGPWELNQHRYPNGKLTAAPYIYAPNGPDQHRHICEPFIDGEAGDAIQAEQEANARLIAAAPDLLAACEGALFALGECSVGKEKLSDLFPKKVEALQAAIAKAKNQTEPAQNS